MIAEYLFDQLYVTFGVLLPKIHGESFLNMIYY